MGKITFATIVILFVFAFGCQSEFTGETVSTIGETTTVEFDFRDFTRIEAGHSFDVLLRQGETFAVILEVDEALVPYLDVTKQGDTVSMFLESGNHYEFEGDCLKAYVEMPFVDSIRLSDLASVNGAFDAGSVSLDLGDASSATIRGTATSVDLTAADASRATLGQFSVLEAKVDLSGASNAVVRVSDSLFATLSGASKLSYIGDPDQIDIHTTGAASVEVEN